METLQVIAFDPMKSDPPAVASLIYADNFLRRVRAHPRVLQWTSEQMGEQAMDDDVDDDLEFWADL